MNNFQLTGYVRDFPTIEKINDKKYGAFILVKDNGKTNIPIYLTEKTFKQYDNYCAIGALINVSGYFVSQTFFKETGSLIRLFLIAEKIERLNQPKVKFNRNIILNKLLDLDDPDDLLKKLKKGEKK